MALLCQHAIVLHTSLAVDLKYRWWWLLNAQGISHIRKWRTSWRNFIVLTINQSQNVELDSDSDEIHIEIKENVVKESEDSKVVVAPKVKMGKVTFVYNSDDSDEEKETTQKKTTFENESDDAIPESVSKLNKIVSYDDTDSGSLLLTLSNLFLDYIWSVYCIFFP